MASMLPSFPPSFGFVISSLTASSFKRQVSLSQYGMIVRTELLSKHLLLFQNRVYEFLRMFIFDQDLEWCPARRKIGFSTSDRLQEFC